MSKIDEINQRLHNLLPTTEYKIDDYKEEAFKWASNYQSDIQYLIAKLNMVEARLREMSLPEPSQTDEYYELIDKVTELFADINED